jgi:hypothetical protein
MAKQAAKRKTKKVNLGKAGSWTSHPGRLHREMGIPEGQKIPMEKKRAALHSKNPQERRDARAAIGYAHMDHSGSGAKKKSAKKPTMHRMHTDGHNAIGSHSGYHMTMGKKK